MSQSPGRSTTLMHSVRQRWAWMVLVSMLLAIIVFQAVRGRRKGIEPAHAFGVPAYAQHRVKLQAGGQRLGAILDDLSKQSGVRIDRYWPTPSLGEVPLDPNMLLELPARDCTLREALVMLQRLCQSRLYVEYESDRIAVGEAELIRSWARAYAVVYPIEDLLEINDPVSPGSAKEARLTNLRDMIKATVSPVCWVDNGGTIGSEHYFSGNLIITATQGMHWEIEELLRLLRAR